MDDLPSSHSQRHYVYTLAYPDGRVFYVGKGCEIRRKGRGGDYDRIEEHEREARTGKTTNPYKVNVIRKIWSEGGEVVKKKLAYFETHEDAIQYEIALIFFMDGLTNLTDGGDGVYGLVRTEEHNRKISQALKGRPPAVPLSPEVRQRIAEKNRGRRHTPEAIQRMSEAKKGATRSAEHRRKLSEANKGKVIPEETRQKISQANKGRIVSDKERERIGALYRGKSLSEEHRRKLSASHKGKKLTPEQVANLVAHNAKTCPGFISPDGVIYRDVTNLRQFALQHGLNPSNLSKLVKGTYSQTNGWRALS